MLYCLAVVLLGLQLGTEPACGQTTPRQLLADLLNLVADPVSGPHAKVCPAVSFPTSNRLQHHKASQCACRHVQPLTL